METVQPVGASDVELGASADAVHWRVRPGWESVLAGAGEAQVREWLANGSARIVKQGTHRTVYRIDLPAVSFHLKQYSASSILRRLAQLVRRSPSRREWDKAAEIARRNVPTLVPVGCGERRVAGFAGDSFLATETLPTAVALDEYLDRRLSALDRTEAVMARRLAVAALARQCAAAHRAGVDHDDLHLGNVLAVPPECSDVGEPPRLLLIDVPGVRLDRRGRSLSWRRRRASLAMLNASVGERATRSERLAFWRTYLADCPTPPRDERREIAAIGKATSGHVRRIMRGRDKRALATNRDFHRLAAAGAIVHCVADLAPDDARSLAVAPDEPIRANLHRPLKLSRSSAVVEAEITIAGSPASIVYKRFRVAAAKAWLGRTAARRVLSAWRIGHALYTRGIATPRPIAAIAPHGRFQDGYLAVERLEGALNLHLYGWDLARRDSAERDRRARQAAESLGRLVGKLHAWNFSHRDLKGCNLMLAETGEAVQSWLVDLDGVALRRALSSSLAMRNLARLAASLEAHPWIGRTTKLRGLLAYLKAAGRPRRDWKPCWRAIEPPAAAIVERLRQSGGPIA